MYFHISKMKGFQRGQGCIFLFVYRSKINFQFLSVVVEAEQAAGYAYSVLDIA